MKGQTKASYSFKESMVKVRLTSNEHKDFQRKCEAMGVTMSFIIRAMINTITSDIDIEDIKRLNNDIIIKWSIEDDNQN